MSGCNLTTSIPTEVKSQNSVFGKFEYSVDKQQLNANENSNSGNGISLGQSAFKNLLLNSKALNNGGSKGNEPKTEILGEETSPEQEVNSLDGNDINPQGISPLDIKILMSSSSLNSNAWTLKKDDMFSNIEEVEAVEVDKSDGSRKVDESGKVDEGGKVGFSNGTFMKIPKEGLTQTSSPAIAIPESDGIIPMEASLATDGSADETPARKEENKELNQEKQASLKETDLRGIERAAYSNNKEINLEKMEKLAGIKEKNDEKSMGVENCEAIASTNKPGNLVSDPIEGNLKNQKLENVPVYNQIAEEIAAKIEQKGPMEFKLQLKPENLGEIDISIKISEGKLSIDILSANSKTQDLLVSQVDKLVTKLGLQNFQIETIQVNPNSILASQDITSQSSLINLGMNFSDRRQQETLKEQNGLRKGTKAVSSLDMNEKDTNNSQGVLNGKNYSGHKINYSF